MRSRQGDEAEVGGHQFGHRHGAQHRMPVGVDQAWRQGPAAAVDGQHAFRGPVSASQDRGDPAAFYQDVAAVLQAGRRAVEKTKIGEQQRLVRRSAAGPSRGKRRHAASQGAEHAATRRLIQGYASLVQSSHDVLPALHAERCTITALVEF
ncbi:hypothetical protein D3C87_1248600 [compost metagenome]